MQDRMFYAAYVLIDWEPVTNSARIKRRPVIVRIGVAEEIPRRINERIHCVGFPASRAAALRTFYIYELGHIRQGRLPLASEFHIFRQPYGQILVRHRNDPAQIAV